MTEAGVENIRNNQQLLDYINHGNDVKYLFFWGHQPDSNMLVNKSCLSQWYEAGFEIEGVWYKTAEHFMMAKKAELFSDNLNAEKILVAEHPGEAKKLGREVKGFDDAIWLKKRVALVVEGNLAKFSQNEGLNAFLKQTKNRVLVEASPVDKVWGIGMASDNAGVNNPHKWKGLNLLGYALMSVRSQLLDK